jgi:putative oxidoreductase
MARGDGLQLRPLERFSDEAVLLLRLLVGVFLILGVWDNITSVERMTEFEVFLRRFGAPWPAVAAPLSVWAQFFCGLAFVFGVLTRPAGLVCAFNFFVAWVLVGRVQTFREGFDILLLILLGLLFATYGSGRWGVDTLLAQRDSSRFRR